jgi:hypothetical protein
MAKRHSRRELLKIGMGGITAVTASTAVAGADTLEPRSNRQAGLNPVQVKRFEVFA